LLKVIENSPQDLQVLRQKIKIKYLLPQLFQNQENKIKLIVFSH